MARAARPTVTRDSENGDIEVTPAGHTRGEPQPGHHVPQCPASLRHGPDSDPVSEVAVTAGPARARRLRLPGPPTGPGPAGGTLTAGPGTRTG